MQAMLPKVSKLPKVLRPPDTMQLRIYSPAPRAEYRFPMLFGLVQF